jgi:hypothetical protein
MCSDLRDAEAGLEAGRKRNGVNVPSIPKFSYARLSPTLLATPPHAGTNPNSFTCFWCFDSVKSVFSLLPLLVTVTINLDLFFVAQISDLVPSPLYIDVPVFRLLVEFGIPRQSVTLPSISLSPR